MKSKITIMKKPEISDEEIRSHMDFDRLLIQHKSLKDVARNHLVAKIMFCVSVAIVGLWFGIRLFEKSENQKTRPSAASEQKIPTPSDSVQQKSLDTTTEQSETKPQVQELQEQKKPKSLTDAHQKLETKRKEESSVADEKQPESTVAAQPVYVQAEPVDGIAALYNYFSSELKYPEAAMMDSIQGVVIVVFTINAKGESEKISIDQSLGKAFDDEAVRLIRNMPAWKPATYNEKPVPSRISLPITFQIRKLKSKQ